MIKLNNKAENNKAVEGVKRRMIKHFNAFLSLINTNGIEISENDDDRERILIAGTKDWVWQLYSIHVICMYVTVDVCKMCNRIYHTQYKLSLSKYLLCQFR